MWLKIGEFAELSRVSARMLRHYDRVGILKPIHIDVATGYRYYSIDQLPRLKRICALRDLAFTLDDIALLLADDEPSIDLWHLFEQKRQELRQRIAEDQARVQRIEARLRTLEQEYRMETHNENEILTTLLAEQYNISVGRVERLHGDSLNHLYHAVDTTGKHWDAYVSRADALADTVYTTWLSGYGGYSLPDFQLSRAGILAHLETEQYPTQRLRRTHNDDVLGYREGWSVLLTSKPPSLAGQPVLAVLRGLGAALGRLHTLSTQVRGDQSLPIGQGWFYPEHALREALHYLDAARMHMPLEWHPLLEAFSTTLQTIQQAELPRTLTHGDPLIAKAAQAENGAVTLRDWHSGGLGVAALDLGRLLLACHWNPDSAWPYQITPDTERIEAVLDGYMTYRTLITAEHDLLREAIQFSIAYGGAEHIAHAMTVGWTPKLEQKLAARKQWFEASKEIARLAHTYLG